MIHYRIGHKTPPCALAPFHRFFVVCSLSLHASTSTFVNGYRAAVLSTQKSRDSKYIALFACADRHIMRFRAASAPYLMTLACFYACHKQLMRRKYRICRTGSAFYAVHTHIFAPHWRYSIVQYIAFMPIPIREFMRPKRLIIDRIPICGAHCVNFDLFAARLSPLMFAITQRLCHLTRAFRPLSSDLSSFYAFAVSHVVFRGVSVYIRNIMLLPRSSMS